MPEMFLCVFCVWLHTAARAAEKPNEGGGELPAPAGLSDVAIFELTWRPLSSAGFVRGVGLARF